MIRTFVAGLLVCLCMAQQASAHGTPITVYAQEGKLFTTSYVEGDLEYDSINDVWTTTYPGLSVTHDMPGSFPVGTDIYLSVERLLMSDGNSLLDSNATANIFTYGFADVSPIHSSSGWQDPMFWMKVESPWHKHGAFEVAPNLDPETAAYGFVARVSIAGYETSAPFVIAMNKGLSAGDFAGAQNLFAAAVPEPSSLALAGLAAIGLAGIAWKRRRRAV